MGKHETNSFAQRNNNFDNKSSVALPVGASGECGRTECSSSSTSSSSSSLSSSPTNNSEFIEAFNGSLRPRANAEDFSFLKDSAFEYVGGHVSGLEEYLSLWRESVEDPSAFWLKMSKDIYFKTPPSTMEPILQYNFDTSKGPVFTRFMADATTNVSYNCIDVHVNNGLGNKVALIWEGNETGISEELTYGDLLSRVCSFANGLKSLGVKAGDVVAIYMPMVPEIAIAMLACARIGAVHSVIFAGYSAESLADRLVDANVRVLITADGSYRGTKLFQLKQICDQAISKCAEDHAHIVSHCVVLRHLEKRTPHKTSSVTLTPGRDVCWDDLTSSQSVECPPLWVGGEHPLFLLYTSGSTGKPKGMVHTTAGYFLFASTVFKFSFDFRKKEDVFWGTSDMGWCAAHTNVLYGPLSLGGTTLILEGTPFYPSITRPWELIDKYRVTQFYTAPTVIRHLMKFGPEPVEKYSRSSLRVLGTVGEPMHPQVRDWYFSVVGSSRCPIVDTYGQTETGGHLLTSVPGTTPTNEHVLLPFFGATPILTPKDDDNISESGGRGDDEGCLGFTQPWPALARAINGDSSNERYEEYFNKVPNTYFTGDAARRDGVSGGYTILGRVDDMLNVSGHLISTTQVESALMQHPLVLECSVVSVGHEVKGQSLAAFVVIQSTHNENDESKFISQLETKVREKVGSFAVPDSIVLTPILPLTRSGKVLKRLLSHLATPLLLNSSSSSNRTTTTTVTVEEPLALLLADTSVIPTLVNAIQRHSSSAFSRNYNNVDKMNVLTNK